MGESSTVTETRKLNNRARGWAEARLRVMHRREWLMVWEQVQKAYPELTSNSQRSKVLTTMRRRHKADWQRLNRMAQDAIKREFGWTDSRATNSGAKIRPRPTLEVACPMCGSKPGEPCRYPTGAARRDHVVRERALSES